MKVKCIRTNCVTGEKKVEEHYGGGMKTKQNDIRKIKSSIQTQERTLANLKSMSIYAGDSIELSERILASLRAQLGLP